MVKKRLIFELIYADGVFCLSRNFQLQKIGDARWLLDAYHLPEIAEHIDELIVVDASRGRRDIEKFASTVRLITTEVFLPLTLGGGIKSERQVETLLNAGADKVLLNSLFHESPETVQRFVRSFGQQFIVMGIDIKFLDNRYLTYINNGSTSSVGMETLVSKHFATDAGELFIQSIDRDGTGHGLDMRILEALPEDTNIPVILAGGIGRGAHIVEGLKPRAVSAVSTANLLNFIGDGLPVARAEAIASGSDLPFLA